MFRRSKRLIVSLVAASALAVAPVPAQGSSAALGPCTLRSTGISVADWREVVAVAGTYQAVASGGYDVRLTCGIVRDGVTVAKVSESGVGPVAVVAGTATVLVGSYSPCYEVRVSHIEHTSSADTCP
ncbi:MAG: hypothetical protein ACRDLB_10580 [Actinomycetota bacterium]